MAAVKPTSSACRTASSSAAGCTCSCEAWKPITLMRPAYRLGRRSAGRDLTPRRRSVHATRQDTPLHRARIAFSTGRACSGGCVVALALTEQQQPGVGLLQGRGEQVALRQPGAAVAEVGALQLLLDALGHDLQVQRAAEVDQPAQDRRHGLLVLDRADEGAVDLEDVDGELAQVRQRRVAGAEVVEGQL